MVKETSRAAVERWGVFELALEGPRSGNPFKETRLTARFEHEKKRVECRGFYDGDGVYKVRFMPERTGEWRYVISSNCRDLDGRSGSFTCTDPAPGNHGPVRVSETHHFSHADGTPFFVMGTTAYAWTYRPEAVRRQTLESFSKYGFNKIRMLFFPKHYGDGKDIDISYDPPVLPFRGEKNHLDFSFFEVEYFRSFEERVRELMELGIQADVILFHFYDSGHWGIDTGMSPEDDLFYLDYLIARLAAYRNVWWSLANEYDLALTTETVKGQIRYIPRTILDQKKWDQIGRFVDEHDPYGHPISVHNWPFGVIYPNREWLSHVSYQHPNTYSLLLELRRSYQKPVVNDEYQYEGNVPALWGNCPPETELYRHWLAVMAGGYATHGEAYKIAGNPRDIFWSYGGAMVGGSPSRLRFLKEIMEACPFQEMEPDLQNGDGRDIFCLRKGAELYLYFITPEYKDRDQLILACPDGEGREYEATVYDAWNCTQEHRGSLQAGFHRDLALPKWAVVKLARVDAAT